MLSRVLPLLALFAFGNTNPAMPVYDVIIVGMGAAGCTAASELCKAGKKVLALEAQNRVGGRVNTVPFGDGLVELGAEWIHGERPSMVYDLAIKNNVSIRAQDVSFQAYRSDGSTTDTDVLNDLVTFALETVDDPPEKPEPLGQYLTRRIRAYIAEKHPALLNDEPFIQEFLNFMDLVINNYESSNSWNDVTTHSAYQDLEGNLHLSWHKYGYKTLFEILLNKYQGGPGFPNLDLQLEKVVSKISYPQTPTEDVEVTCEDGTSYRARHVISTVSLGVMKESHTTLFAPVLPESKISSIEGISMGLIGKIILLFPYPFLVENKTDSFFFFWNVDDKKELEGDWSSKIVGATVPMGNRNAVTVWTCKETAKLLPNSKIDSFDHISLGVVGKIVLNFDQVFWNTSFAGYAFIWKPEDRNAVPYDDRWILKIEGADIPMGSNTSLVLWTNGDDTKLVSKSAIGLHVTDVH